MANFFQLSKNRVLASRSFRKTDVTAPIFLVCAPPKLHEKGAVLITRASAVPGTVLVTERSVTNNGE